MTLHDFSPGTGPKFGALLFNQLLAASAASFDIQNISQDFGSLFILAKLRTDEAVVGSFGCFVRVNNDSGSNYDLQYVQGNNASSDINVTNGGTSWNVLSSPGSSASANTFGLHEIWLPFYTDAGFKSCVQRTTMFGTSGTASTYRLYTVGAQWRSTAAITRVALNPPAGKNFVAGSQVSLYGVP